MKDRKNRAIARRIQELVGVPASCERSCFSFTISDHASSNQVRIIKDCAVRMNKRVAKLTTFIDRSGSLRRGVTGYSAGKRKLREQPLHSVNVLRDAWVVLAVSSFQICIRNHSRAAVARSANIDYVQVEFFDYPVEMGVDEVKPRRRAPMPEQSRFNILNL